jgi:hypothetical protein
VTAIERFVLGVPIDGAKRKELRRLTGGLIPAKVSGSVERACSTCGLACWVGPRGAATGCPAVCPWCAVKIQPALTVDLGNPESRLEGDS